VNKKFIWLIVSCLMVAALVLASCAPAVVEEKEATVVTKEPEKKAEKVEEVVEEKVGPQYGGIITHLFSEAPLTFDPIDIVYSEHIYKSFTHNNLITADWYQDRALCDFTGRGEVPARPDLWVGDLLESWEQPDPLTIIFNIRKGVRWQNKPPVNGRELTADDVVWTFKRYMDIPKFSSYSVASIDTITVPDKYTVVITVKKPNVMLLGDMTIISYTSHILAHEVVETYGDERDWRNQVGTGPFILDDYVKGSSLTWSRNPDYFGKDPNGNQLPFIDGIRLLLIGDSATQIAALRTGKVDLILPETGIDWNQKFVLEKTNPELQWKGGTPAANWCLYLKNTIKPFSDIRVRYALSMGINREEMVASVFGDNAIIYHFPANPGWQSFPKWEELPDSTKEIYTYNPEKAKELLAEAGYPNGFETCAQYCADAIYTPYGTAMELLQAQWATIGVDLELRPVDNPTMSAIRSTKQYDQIFPCGTGHSIPVRFSATNYYTDGRFNRSLCSDPYVDELTDRALLEFDTTKHDTILKEIWLYLLEQCFDIGLPAPYRYTAWHPWVKGYQGEADWLQGRIFTHIWLDQDLKQEVLGK